jgi:hypothetical protein
MKRLSLALAVTGALALGASQRTALAADVGAYEAAPGRVAWTHGRVTKRLVAHRCIEVSQPARGCPLRRYSLLPWPGIPRCHLVGDICVYFTAPDLEEWAHDGY